MLFTTIIVKQFGNACIQLDLSDEESMAGGAALSLLESIHLDAKAATVVWHHRA